MDEALLATERRALALLDELLDVPDALREAWITRFSDDPGVAERLRAMAEADRIATLRTGGAALDGGDTRSPPPERIGRYRLTSLIGRGGMGAVWRAERDAGDFAHEVAIKLIKPGLLGEALSTRFAAERQTLAGLNHAGIARLYDGGETPDGQPYIVMELIDGIPIDRWAEVHVLDSAGRRRLVRDVALAVAYAHARLVTHRDITPLNVLVTADGTPKLIDFGIARPADDSDASTAIDIAALGRLLARLLPRPTPEEAAIIARATAGDDARRYPTAQALADDLAALDAGRPVAAMGGRRRYRWSKFVARNRVGVAAGAVALVALVGGLAATLVANAQARRAEAEATARFEQTRGIARAMLFDVFDSVSRVPGATAAREMLARTSADYLDALAAVPNPPADVRAEAGRGFVKLAAVVGGGQAASLGLDADAPALLARAAALIEPAYAAAPDDPSVAEAFAALRLEQAGTNLYNENAPEPALRQAVQAEAAVLPFARVRVDAAKLTAVAIQTQGDARGWNDDYAGAAVQHQRAERFISGLPPAIRASEEVRSARSANLRLLGEAWQRTGRSAQARAALDSAVAINRSLVADDPDRPDYVRKLSVSLWYSASFARDGREAAAHAEIVEAVERARWLVARDPQDKGALRPLALAAETAAVIEGERGDRVAAIGYERQSLDAHARLVELAGESPGALRSMTVSQRAFGSSRLAMGDRTGACALWHSARANFETLDARGQLSQFDRNNGLADVRADLRKHCAA